MICDYNHHLLIRIPTVFQHTIFVPNCYTISSASTVSAVSYTSHNLLSQLLLDAHNTHHLVNSQQNNGLPHRRSRENCMLPWMHVTDTWLCEFKIRVMCACCCFCQLPEDVPVCERTFRGNGSYTKKKYCICTPKQSPRTHVHITFLCREISRLKRIYAMWLFVKPLLKLATSFLKHSFFHLCLTFPT